MAIVDICKDLMSYAGSVRYRDLEQAYAKSETVKGLFFSLI